MQQLVDNYFPANNNKARIKRIASNNDQGVNQNMNIIEKVNRQTPQLIKLMHNNNANRNHVVFESNKPKYHFNYGQPINKQVTIQYNNINKPINFANVNQANQLNTSNFTLLPHHVQNQYVKTADQNHSSVDKRRRLKIFPQKYKDETQKNTNITKEKEQINFLKKQLLKLKEQIVHQQKNRISYSVNQSTKKQLNQSQIQKLQYLRTKRLAQLQNYNQTLYNQLAWKLKDIATDQYEVYLQKSKPNKMHLQELYENSSAKKSRKSKHKYNKYNDNFIDINDFQELYEQSFKQKDSLPMKISQQATKKQNIKVNQTIYNSRRQDNIYSPFLLIQNYKQTFKPIQNDLAPNRQSFQNLKENINEAYTFHKGNVQKMKNVSHMAVKQISNKSSIQMKINKNNDQVMKVKQKRQIHLKNTPQKQNPHLQIHDLNRELENKLQRKRIQSDYAKGIYNTGKSNLRQR